MKPIFTTIFAAAALAACTNTQPQPTSRALDAAPAVADGSAGAKLDAMLLSLGIQPERRAADESASDARARWEAAKAANSPAGLELATTRSAHDSAGDFANIDVSSVPEWSVADLNATFAKVRDAQSWEMNGAPGKARRLSWMYPDDGCYMRAGLMSDMAEASGLARPAKVFTFGNLQVTGTPNTASGTVEWGYHVAPLVHTPSGYFVLDPAINPDKPTELQAWILRQVTSLQNVAVAVCNAHAFAPDSACADAVDDQASVTVPILEGTFLELEWNRQTDLKRDAARLLLSNDNAWMHP